MLTILVYKEIKTNLLKIKVDKEENTIKMVLLLFEDKIKNLEISLMFKMTC